MEQVGSEIGTYLISQGPIGVLALIMTGLYVYERKGRSKDREDFDNELKEAQLANIETLKIILPLVQKLTTTMDTVLPLLMRNLDRRQG
ncbi:MULTISPECIES: hypothetical protein [Rhizobium]|uniref:Uncharacterized protein n=1 Tax=Rhizobium indigoferae TaxID=158891 RepID=A0ABZ0ZDY2_9HYPH|nr:MULTISPECIES: hypothetical protein [Rhizobium]YP_009099600.1 involved in bacteriocin production or immunity [Rhizobium phage vB_RleM_PPF1]AID18350.1 hypothetical protein PPF1_37 [Rhizobium phage vB_RleM_PPF1]MBY2911334.1 hypothetical protein [Rhizobium leguminosarum]NNU55080.1 hypothetical protein [Rhizobium indigoferae]WQN36649.1 hypothetical protein U5G49_001738 [Rhizobium indigoferae]GLR61153.1 hypothetical protein GCM10007919_58820 [Rhizobium indigoferae]